MWSNRGLRGSVLEELLHYTHEYYHQLKLCRIDKISTPVKVVEIDHKGVIEKGFFEKKATVDFIGIMQGVFIAFDAKETNLKSLPLKNIHAHQMAYMKDVTDQGGLAFIIVHFKYNDTYFLVPYETLESFYKSSSRRSIPYTAMQPEYEIKKTRGGSVLNYIEALNAYIGGRQV